jgi:hypothetical protein
VAPRKKSGSSKPRKMPREKKPITEAEHLELLATVTRMINAWEKHAPDKKFAGMTVDEFRKATQPSFDAHAEVERLEWELAQLRRAVGDDDSPPPKGN